MAEGYTVNEAAEVLGVPQSRVWELIARGVLAGSREGDEGMRVFLQPQAESVGVQRAEAGTGTDAAAFASSPFRELLSEFRNLTERYGQALLALGESRGEVEAKNKGSIAMHFVHRLRPEFSADEDGFEPNDRFRSRRDVLTATGSHGAA